MSLGDNILDGLSKPEPIAMEIEAWGVTVYFTPFTLAESQKIAKKHPGLAENPIGNAGGIVEALIMKLKDEHGEPVFTLEHKAKLMRRPVDEIAGVFVAINGASETVEGAEKN